MLPPTRPLLCGGALTSGQVLVAGVRCYSSINVSPGATLNVIGDPGRSDNVVYVLGGLSVRGTLSATNVLIYVANGDVDVSGQAVTTLQPSSTSGPWQGFTLWVAHGHIHLTGGATNQWTGTIYAPGSPILANGDSRNSLRGTVIAGTIELSGNSSTAMSCDPGRNFRAANLTP